MTAAEDICGEDREAVSRSRRFAFVAAVVGFCLVMAALFAGGAGLGILQSNLVIVSTFIDGMMGLATATGLAYITGSVIDYNGGIAGAFGIGRPGSASAATGGTHVATNSENTQQKGR